MTIVNLYTDGACSGNQNEINIGGWGAVLEYGEHKKSILARRIAAMLSYIVLNNLDRIYVNEIGQEKLVQGKGMTGRQSFQKIL